jgi:hypothetical protein
VPENEPSFRLGERYNQLQFTSMTGEKFLGEIRNNSTSRDTHSIWPDDDFIEPTTGKVWLRKICSRAKITSNIDNHFNFNWQGNTLGTTKFRSLIGLHWKSFVLGNV